MSDDQVKQAEEHFNRGRMLSMKGLYLEAINAYKKALELDPGHTRARTNLHFIRYFRGMSKTEDRIKNVANFRNVPKGDRGLTPKILRRRS